MMNCEFSLESISTFIQGIIKNRATVPYYKLVTEVQQAISDAEWKAEESLDRWSVYYQKNRVSNENIQTCIRSKKKKVEQLSRAVYQLADLALKGNLQNPKYIKMNQSERRTAFRHQANECIFFKKQYVWDEALLHNISKTGAMISTLKQLQTDEQVILNLVHKEKLINEQIMAKVVWKTMDNKFGLHFNNSLPSFPTQYL